MGSIDWKSRSVLVMWIFCLAAFVLSIVGGIASDFGFSSSPAKDFHRIKAGFPIGKGGYWHYSGSIYNPSTGKPIAGVEGLECVCPSRKCKAAVQAETNGSAQTPVISYLSKKFFIYVDPQNHSQPLTTFKLSKISPARRVKPERKFYQKIVLLPPSSENEGVETSQIWMSLKRNLSYSNVEIRNPKEKTDSQERGFNMDVVEPRITINHSIIKREKSPLGNKWISFAPVSRITGSLQESYAFYRKRRSLLPFGPFDYYLQYKRIGLGPSWYLPGRNVVTELKAKRYQRYEELPTTIRELVATERMIDNDPLTLGEEFASSQDIYQQFRPWYKRILDPFGNS